MIGARGSAWKTSSRHSEHHFRTLERVQVFTWRRNIHTFGVDECRIRSMRLRLRLDRLEQLLEGSRVSQNHWAMRLGLSRGHWSDLLKGNHPYPSAKTRQRMIEVFGVGERDLFEPDHGDGAAFDFRVAIAARFELTSEIGQGGMGTVYLANDLTLRRVVALKMVAAEAAAGIGVDALLQEVATVSRLQHPNILPLFDAGERAGSPFYVMPWIRAGSLGALLREKKRLGVTEAISLIKGIAAGLSHAHEHRVLHCDIKPENILVENGHPYVMDFGIARKLHSEAREWSSLRKELDFSAGTPAYVSPEQASGESELDARSDIYSLACVAYEMLTGRAPFRGENTQQIVSIRFREPPVPVQHHAPDVPLAVSRVIEEAMSINPAHRPESAVEFARALEQAAAGTAPWRSALSVGSTRVLRRAREMALGAPPSRENPTRMREWVHTLRQDLAYSVRQRRRSPGLTTMAIATLALGIGLTTAVFAVMNSVVFRPLPFNDPGQLVELKSVDSTGGAFARVSSANWNDWDRLNQTLAASAIHQPGRASLTVGSESMRANLQAVSKDFFSVLQARFVSGRGFSDADLAQPGVVVSEGFWRSKLGGADIRDKTIAVNGEPRTIIGVVRGNQVYPESTEVWLLIQPRTFGGRERNNINYEAIARLAPGVTVERAAADLSTIARRINETDPGSLYSHGVGVTPLDEHLVGGSTDLLNLLFGSVGLVLLIACANLASANLAQDAVRSREMAIRSALGGARQRLVRQVLVDNALVALVGGSLGVLLAWSLVNSASVLSATKLPRTGEIAVDARVVAFAFVVATMAGILTGLLPALRATRTSPARALEGGSRNWAVGGRGLPGRAFVAAEVAMALMLVTVAGSLVQSLRAVLSRPLGFETRGVVVAEITLSGPRYRNDSAAVVSYWERLRQSMTDVPGIQGAGLVNWVPLVRGGSGMIDVEGKDIAGAGAGYRMISEGYFDALGIRLLEGRSFDVTDRSDGPRVAVINKRLADRYWPGESPLGRRLRATSMEPMQDAPAPWLTIVGVVSDARPFGYEAEETAEMYVLYRQLPSWRFGTMNLLVRTAGPEESAMHAVRERISRIDPAIPADLAFMRTHANQVTAWRRFMMSALSVFGGLSLLLAAMGVYGVLSFAAAQRTREIAIRAALGADRGRLVRLVLDSGARVLVIGLAIGLVGTWYLMQLVRGFLFQVEPRDPLVFGVSIVTIVLVGAIAAFIPARRASRVDPMHALRSD
jgi:putative ABC transport system permease protein